MPAAAVAPNPESRMTREEFLRTYTPATPEETLLATHAWRSWTHLQDMFDLRDALVSSIGLAKFFTEQQSRYKQLMRDLNQAERAWRNAIEAFWKARRRVPARPAAVSVPSPAVRTSPPPARPSVVPPEIRTSPNASAPLSSNDTLDPCVQNRASS